MSRTAEELREDLKQRVRETNWVGPATEKQVGYVCGLLGKIVGIGMPGDMARHQLLDFLFGKSSSKNLTKGEANALIDWLTDPEHSVSEEVYAALGAWGAEHGQMEMPL